MKTISMKKFFSLLLCLCMLLSMNSTAFAAEGEENTCDHVWNEGVVTLEPTCTTEGVKTFTCTVDECGKTKEEPIPAAHSWDEGTVTLEPTCTTAGVKTYSCTADGCGKTITEPIPATNVHNYVDGICAYDDCRREAECTKAENCPALSHEADCLSQLCDKCGNDNHEGSCPCNKEATCPANDDAHEADCVKKLTDEANKAKIAEVNALIAALPDVVTSGNYDSVMAQLYVIKAKETELGAELWSQVDHAKLNAVILATQAPLTADECTCTAKCDAATTACLFCKNGGTCPKGPAVAKIGEVGYDSLDAALKAANAMTSAVTITICGVAVYSDSSPNLAATPGSISFVGEGSGAEIRITRNGSNGYICGAGSAPAVSFSNLILSKPAGGHASDAGFMNCGFTTYRVASVSYSGCTFPNGAAAGGCATNYSGCTFGKSHDKYALWLYGNPDVNVDNCIFDCDRGVKMYSVLGAEPELSVTNSDFSKLTGKPAIVMTHAESVSLSGNTYSETGTLELEAGAQGAAFSSTDPVVCKTEDSGGTLQPSGVLVDGKIYITVTDAAAVAESGDTVTLLYDSEETVELPVGVTLDKGSFEAGGVTVAATVAKIGDTLYGSLQEAIDAAYTAGGNVTIDLLDNISGTYTVKEKVGLYLTINGGGKTLAGTIKVTALSDTNDNRRTTISGLNFVNTGSTATDFISAGASNYYPRLTVDGCSFTGNGSGIDVAVRTKDAYGLVISNCTGTKLHSFLQNTAGVGITVTGVTVTDSKSGISTGTAQGITISGCNIAAGAGYGIRIDANTYNNNASISNNTVSAFIPVCVRKVNAVSNISFSGNTMTQTNSDGYWCVIGTEEYEENGGLPTTGLDKVFVSGLSAQQEEGVYGAVFAEASIGSKLYPTLREAIAAAKDGDTIKLLRDIELSSTLIIGDPNGAFNKIGITIDGNGKTLKAVGSGWNDNMWLVDVTYNAAISDLTIDGSNTGCKGIQFYTSNSSLTNAVIKNISADKWGYTDYALHSNASNVALSGVSLVDCKHGHIIVDIGSNTGRTESVIKATGSVSGATVILNNAGAKATAAQDGLTVIKGTDASIAGHILVYENGSYVLVTAKASIGSTAYPSVEAALAAAKDGDTVTLLADAGDISVSSSITLDLNGNSVGDITVASGKTLSVSEEDLAAAGSLSLADSLGDVKVGNNVIGLEDGTIAATSAGLSVTPSGSGKSYVSLNDMFVGVPAGSSLILNADGSAKIPAGGSVVFAGSFEVPVAAESALAADGTLTLYPAEVQDYGYGKVTVTYGESAKSETVFVPAGKSLTVKADKNGNPVYDSSAEEDPIVTAGSVEKPKLSITPSRKAFYKFGLGTLSFTCNGFCDTLETVSVDGVGLNDTAYTLQRGSTIVKLKNDYLKTLALGDHTLKLTYADGQTVTATISIVNTPVTGDSNNLAIWLAVLGLSGLLCTAAVLVLKRRRA